MIKGIYIINNNQVPKYYVNLLLAKHDSRNLRCAKLCSQLTHILII